MHSFYLRSCYGRNDFAHGELELAGERIGAGDDCGPTRYILAAIEDHIVPWRSSLRDDARCSAGNVRFVLSSAGHIAGIVNPPSPKSRYWTNDELPADPAAWQAGAELHEGSWWEDWTRWIAERSGGQREPPPLGSERYPPLADAPGAYILDASSTVRLIREDPRVTGQTVSLRGHEIFVRERGKGFPLLLLNGIGANVDMLGAAATMLAKRSRTIVFDAPGTGRSSTPIFPLSIASVAQVARDLLDELGHAQADVLGFSHGGLVAQELARIAPDRVRRLALVSTTCGWGSSLGDPSSALDARDSFPLLLALVRCGSERAARRARPQDRRLAARRAPRLAPVAPRLRVPAARGRDLVEPLLARDAAAADARDRGRRRPCDRAGERRPARSTARERPAAAPAG